MIAVQFTLMIFQRGELSEELTTPVVRFETPVELATSVSRFAALNSRVSLHALVIPLSGPKGGLEMVPLPATKKGYGPNTCVVIKEVIPA